MSTVIQYALCRLQQLLLVVLALVLVQEKLKFFIYLIIRVFLAIILHIALMLILVPANLPSPAKLTNFKLNSIKATFIISIKNKALLE